MFSLCANHHYRSFMESSKYLQLYFTTYWIEKQPNLTVTWFVQKCDEVDAADRAGHASFSEAPDVSPVCFSGVHLQMLKLLVCCLVFFISCFYMCRTYFWCQHCVCWYSLFPVFFFCICHDVLCLLIIFILLVRNILPISSFNVNSIFFIISWPAETLLTVWVKEVDLGFGT